MGLHLLPGDGSNVGANVCGFGFRISGFGILVSGFGIRVSGFGFRDSGFGFLILGFGCWVSVLARAAARETPAFGLGVPVFEFRGSGFGSGDSGFRFRVSCNLQPGFGFRNSDVRFGLRALDLKFRDWAGPGLCFKWWNLKFRW